MFKPTTLPINEKLFECRSELEFSLESTYFFEYFYGKQIVAFHTPQGKIFYDGYEDEYFYYSFQDSVFYDIEIEDGSQMLKDFHTVFDWAVVDGGKLIGKSAIIVIGFATGGLGTLAGIGIDALSSGAMYYMDGDENALMLDLALAPLGAAGDFIGLMKKANYVDNLVKPIMKTGAAASDEVSVAYKAARDVYLKGKTIDPKIAVLIERDGKKLLVPHGAMKKYADDIEMSPQDFSTFVDDLTEMATKSGKHDVLFACAVGGGNILGDRGAGNRSVGSTVQYCGLDAYHALLKGAKSSTNNWIRRSPELIERMVAKQVTHSYDDVAAYYKNFQMPTQCLESRPRCLFTGDGFTVQFDEFGHPRFEPHVPEMEGVGKIFYNPENLQSGSLPSGNNSTLVGNTSIDIEDANNWIQQQYPDKARSGLRPDGTKIPDGRIEILDDNNNWIECTWHHHEDGRNMIPVPSNIHSVALGGAAHVGGTAVIRNKIKDFFLSLQF